MKNKYVKPLLSIETFSLTQSIARDCGDSIPQEQLTFSDPNACAWALGGGATVFIVGGACTIDGTSMEYLCYNNPSEGNYIFRS